MREGALQRALRPQFLTRVKETGLFPHTLEVQKIRRSALQRIVQPRKAR
jgi:hypothetical protein